MTVSSDQSDVLIVGGGPAGSACAWRLRQHGLDVLVIDRCTFPRDKVCAGWITPAVIESLAIDPKEYARERVFQPITGFRVGLVGRDAVEVEYGLPVSYGIRRCEFDEYLLRRSGARIREGEAVSSIERRGDGWVINGRYRAPVLIGAGGHFDPVVRWLREQRGATTRDVTDECVVAAQEVEYVMGGGAGCSIEPCVPELYFYPDLRGYAWCFRKEQVLNIGLGRVHEKNLGTYRRELVDWLLSTGRIDGPPQVRFKGHAYRLNVAGHQPRVSDRLLLIGDAAGLAAARSGEGIRPAIESGLMAADVLAADSGNYRREALERYSRELDLRFHPAAADAGTPSSLYRYVGGRLLSQRWFVRRFVLDGWFLNRRLDAYRPAAAASTA